MTVEEFLKARLAEAESALDMIECLTEAEEIVLSKIIKSLQEVLYWHAKWPVLVETAPVFEPPDLKDTTDGFNHYIMRLSKQFDWMTQEEYRRTFGSEPPTAPMLRTMVNMYNDHPDFNPDWIN